MQLKPIAVIAVLSLVIASVSVAGCTVNFNAPAPTTTPSTPSTKNDEPVPLD